MKTPSVILALLLPFLLCTCGLAPEQELRVASYRASSPIKETVMDGLRRPWSMKFLTKAEALLTEMMYYGFTLLFLLHFGCSSPTVPVDKTINEPPEKGLASARADDRREQVERYLREKYQAGVLNGNVLVVRNNETVYEASFGYADHTKQRLLTAEDRFGLGSIYKEFPALAILQLREQGRLTLEDRLSDHLPDLPPWSTQIQLKHLLRYTAGLPPVDWGSHFAKGKVVTAETLWQELDSLPELAFPPGTDYIYGNYPPFLLIALVEHLTGQSFREYASANLFRPAGLKDITLAAAFPYADSNLMAIPFNEQGVPDNYQLADFHLLYCATARDIARWARALHAGKLIPTAKLAVLGPTHDPTDENQQSALGNCLIDGSNIKWHMHHGSMGNYEGIFLHDRVEDLTIVLLTNQKHYNVHELVETIHAMLLGK